MEIVIIGKQGFYFKPKDEKELPIKDILEHDIINRYPERKSNLVSLLIKHSALTEKSCKFVPPYDLAEMILTGYKVPNTTDDGVLWYKSMLQSLSLLNNNTILNGIFTGDIFYAAKLAFDRLWISEEIFIDLLSHYNFTGDRLTQIHNAVVNGIITDRKTLETLLYNSKYPNDDLKESLRWISTRLMFMESDLYFPTEDINNGLFGIFSNMDNPNMEWFMTHYHDNKKLFDGYIRRIKKYIEYIYKRDFNNKQKSFFRFIYNKRQSPIVNNNFPFSDVLNQLSSDQFLTR